MVSKVAVIALVAIVACPILLGYAMNLSEVTMTEYLKTDDDVNVTPLLQDGTEYSYAAANVVDLNSRFYESGTPAPPDYVELTSTKTSLPLSKGVWNDRVPSSTHTLSDFNYYYFVLDYEPSYSDYAVLRLTFDDNTTTNVYYLHSLYYVAADDVLYISTYTASGGQFLNSSVFGIFDNIKAVSYTKTGNVGTGVMYYNQISNPPSTYVNLSSGFYLNEYDQVHSDGITTVELPDYSNNVLVTMDLSTITNSSYTFDMNQFRFQKSTDGSGVHWLLKIDNNGVYETLTELYYDSTKSSNTYQIFFDLTSVSFRYVGSWPTIMGVANSYWQYDYTLPSQLVYGVGLTFKNGITPKVRIDAADYRAYQYPIIENETYDPSQFRSNPATTISNPQIYGTSITFGGNTYTVSKGNITLGSHQVPVKGLVLSSVAVDGGYENRIGNTVVSTTVNPSTITFNGKWSASITTATMEENTYTKTEWTAGQFGWDGIDHNFLIVGLLTSFGAFIALGIYMRRSKASLWPLLIVCGGAAVLFFIML